MSSGFRTTKLQRVDAPRRLSASFAQSSVDGSSREKMRSSASALYALAPVSAHGGSAFSRGPRAVGKRTS
jgi:hypothetical protein